MNGIVMLMGFYTQYCWHAQWRRDLYLW